MKKRYYKSLIAGAVLASLVQPALADTIGPIEPDQDTWTNGSGAGSGTNYSTQTTLRIDTGKMRGFIQFTVAGIPDGHVVNNATLTLTAQGNKSGNIPDTFIQPVTGVVWDEATLTDLTDDDLLAAAGDTIATATDIAVDATADFDISSGITGNGTYTFLINISDADARATKYYSSDASEEFRPKLNITTVDSAPADTTPPVFSNEISAIEVNATGITTDISAAVAAADITAQDETDIDPIAAVIASETNLASGMQSVTLTATDAAGNVATTNVIVNITPLLALSSDKSIGVGTTASVEVALQGPAVTYPVTLDYTIAGAAVSDTGGSLTFDDTTTQTVDVTLLGDALGGTTGVLTLSNASNAQLPLVDSTTITAVAGNAAPTVTLTLSQNGAELGTITADNADVIHYVDATAGPVTVSAEIIDINTGDSHDISWGGSSADLGAQGLEFDFAPELLAGDFTLNVTATETDNTADKLLSSIPVITTIKVITTALPELVDEIDTDGDGTPDTVVDTDGDGISDKTEGYKDSDGDGIVDYLDHVDVEITQLPLADGQAPLQTEAGLSLSLGSISTDELGITADSAIISLANLSSAVGTDASDDGYFALEGASLINFTLSGSGLPDDGSGSASIVYPLPDGVIITEKTEYRKFTSENVWDKFENSGNNVIASTAKVDVDGALECPVPNDESYDHGLGLRSGDNCIQLTIEDNGIYDANDTNGIIEDPGVLAEANAAPEWSVNSITLADTLVNEGVNLTLTQDLTVTITGEGENQQETSNVSDADGDALTFAKVTGPDWLTVDETGALSANLVGVATGDYTATVSATDTKTQSAETTVNLSVVFNNAPDFSEADLAPASRNEAYSASIAEQISDTEGDTYTIEKVSGPYWLKVSETGELSGTPLKADIGDNNITVKITDDKGAITEATFNVQVDKSDVRASKGGSFSASLLALLGLISLRRRKQK